MSAGLQAAVDANRDTSPAEGIFGTERYGMPSYRFRLAAGRYMVRLHFAEAFVANPGERVFSVRINGAQTMQDLDILAESGARFKGLIKEIKGIDIGAAGGLEVAFVAKAQRACVRGIEVTPEQDGAQALHGKSAGARAAGHLATRGQRPRPHRGTCLR